MPHYGWGTSIVPGTKVVEEVPTTKQARVGAREAAETRCAKCRAHIGTRAFVIVNDRLYHYDPCTKAL